MEKYYYAIFSEEEGKVLVSVPDIEICETFGESWDDAFEMAVDALAACISTGDGNIKKRTSYEDMVRRFPDKKIMAVPVDQSIIDAYSPKKKVNVIFPVDVLKKIDETRGKLGERDRSKFITDGMKEYTKKFA